MPRDQVEDGVSVRGDQRAASLGVERAALVLCGGGGAQGGRQVGPVVPAGEKVATQRGEVVATLADNLLDGLPTSVPALGLLQLGAQFPTELEDDPAHMGAIPADRRRAGQLSPGVGGRSAPDLNGDEQLGVEG